MHIYRTHLDVLERIYPDESFAKEMCMRYTRGMFAISPGYLSRITLSAIIPLRVSDYQWISAKLKPNSSQSTEYFLSLVWWAEYF